MPAPQPQYIEHPEVGKYFSEFCGNYFKLSEQSSVRFPQDLSHTEDQAHKREVGAGDG